jgi:hypothetical protein
MTEERDPAWSSFYPPVTLQSLREHTAPFRLGEAVPREVRLRFERCLATYHASYTNYGLVAQAAEQAWLVIEQAVRMRLQEFPARAALIHAADNGLPPFNRPKPISLQNLLEMAVADGLLSRQWPIAAISERRNWIAHYRDTETINPPMALGTFETVAALVNELWGVAVGT